MPLPDRDVLGFIVVKRPQTFDETFEGCWCALQPLRTWRLWYWMHRARHVPAHATADPSCCGAADADGPPTYNRCTPLYPIHGCRLWRYGLGLHLIKGTPVPRSSVIDPKSDHLSFQVGRLHQAACLGQSCCGQSSRMVAVSAMGWPDAGLAAAPAGPRGILQCPAPITLYLQCSWLHPSPPTTLPPPQADSLDGVQAALRSRGIPFVRQVRMRAAGAWQRLVQCILWEGSCSEVHWPGQRGAARGSCHST